MRGDGEATIGGTATAACLSLAASRQRFLPFALRGDGDGDGEPLLLPLSLGEAALAEEL